MWKKNIFIAYTRTILIYKYQDAILPNVLGNQYALMLFNVRRGNKGSTIIN